MANYSSKASIAAVGGGGITGASSQVTVTNFTNWPAAPFYALIDRENAARESVLVTNVAGALLDITRAQDGTLATDHGVGATFEHYVPASHFEDDDDHRAASTAVHGVAGSVVGTSDTQTLTAKTVRGGFEHRMSDAAPAPTTGFLVTGDSVTARDGFVFSSTVAVTGKAFKVVESGVDRFTVDKSGTTVTAGLSSTTLAASGNATVGGTLGVTGATTLAGTLAAGNTTVTGTLSTTGDATIGGKAVVGAGASTVAGTLAVTGNLSTAAALSGASAAITNAITAGTNITATGTVTGATVAATGAMTAGTTVTATGAVRQYGSSVPVLSSGTAFPGSPVDGQVFHRTDLRGQYRYDGAATAWVPTRFIAGRLVTTGGGPIETDLVSETNIAKLAVENVRVYNGSFYIFHLMASVIFSAAGDAFLFRIRKDTALTGTEIVTFSVIASTGAALGDHVYKALPWKCTADDADGDFYVSVQRTSGTGNIDIYGGSDTAIWVEDGGADTGIWTLVA